MKWVHIKDGMPDKRGNYHVEERLPNSSIVKVSLSYDVLVYIFKDSDRDIRWLDDDTEWEVE